MFKALEDAVEKLINQSVGPRPANAVQASIAEDRVQAAQPPAAAAKAKIYNLSTAENVLLFPQLRDRLTDFSGLTVEETQYSFLDYQTGGKQGSGFAAELNRQAATFLNAAYGLTGAQQLNEGNVISTAGTCAALESLGFALCNPGDTVIAPAPCWQGFGFFFTFRPGATFVPFSVSKSANNEFDLQVSDLEAAYTNVATSGGPPPKVLVLTNPHNPLGINYSAKLLDDIFQWAMAKPGLHVISDEIYFNSQTDPGKPFTTAFKVPTYSVGNNAERIHVVWGLSKDFGLAGYRAAFVATRSPAVLNTLVNKWEYFLSPVSALSNYTIINKLLNDDCAFALDLMKNYKKLLVEQRKAVAAALDNAEIKYYQDDGAAQFFFLDLRDYAAKLSPEPPLPTVPYDIYGQERALYNKMYNQGNAPSVHLEAGHTLFTPEPGWFRLCYTCLSTPDMVDAVDTLGSILKSLSSSSSTSASSSSSSS